MVNTTVRNGRNELLDSDAIRRFSGLAGSLVSKLGLVSASAAIAAGPCMAESVGSPLSFSVTVNSNPSCTFQGISYSNQVTETMTNEASSHYAFSDFTVTKNFDNCTNALYLLVATGAHVPSVIISVLGNVNGHTRELMRFTLSGVTATSVFRTASNNNTETVKFSYQTIATRMLDSVEEVKSHQ